MSMFRRQEGSSLAAVLMVMMVVAALGVTSVQVARHSNDATVVDRERVQALNAAEAGVHEAMRLLASPLTQPCVLPLTPGELKDGRYEFLVQPGQSNNRCVIHSWGYGNTGAGATGTVRTERYLRVDVALKPLDFPYTLFSSTMISVKNNGIVDGMVYADELHQSNNDLTSGDLHSQGSIVTKNNAVYSGELWALGNVTVGNNSTVEGSVTATGNITLHNGALVGADAIAGGTITYAGANIRGSVSENTPNVPPPPALDFPDFPPNALTYTFQNGDQATFNNHLEANKHQLQGTLRFTGGPGEKVVLPDNATVTGPLTIVSNRRIELGSGLMAAGGRHQVVLVALSEEPNAIDVPKKFSAPGLDVLLYTRGGVDGKNKLEFTGAVYARGPIDAKNGFDLHQSDALRDFPPAGFDFSSWSGNQNLVVPTLWRELPPPGDLP